MMRAWWTARLVVLALLCAAVAPAHGIIVKDRPVDTSQEVVSIQRFGFFKGGEVTFEGRLAPNDTEVSLFMCSTTQAVDVDCADLSKSYCELQVHAVGGVLSVTNHTVQHTSHYELLLINCPREDLTGEISYTLVNPGGEHLSSEFIQLPDMYLYLIVAWAALVTAWYRNYFQWRETIPLHKLISSVLVSKAIAIVLAENFWRTCSETGNCSIDTFLLYYVVGITFQGLVYSTIMLVSAGWMITRTVLSAQELKSLMLGTLGLTIAVSAMDSIEVHTMFFLFLFFVVYWFLARFSLHNVARNIAVLRMHMMRLRDPETGGVASGSLLHGKLRMLYQFRNVILAFFTAQGILYVTSAGLERFVWIVELHHEMVFFLLGASFAYIFRLRENTPYAVVFEQWHAPTQLPSFPIPPMHGVDLTGEDGGGARNADIELQVRAGRVGVVDTHVVVVQPSKDGDGVAFALGRVVTRDAPLPPSTPPPARLHPRHVAAGADLPPPPMPMPLPVATAPPAGRTHTMHAHGGGDSPADTASPFRIAPLPPPAARAAATRGARNDDESERSGLLHATGGSDDNLRNPYAM